MCNNLKESQVGVLFGSCCEGRLSGRGHGKLMEQMGDLQAPPRHCLSITAASFNGDKINFN